MKIKNILLELLALLAFIGCENTSNVPYRGPAIQIVKFEKLEYKDYIMTFSPSSMKDGVVTLAIEEFVLPDSAFQLIEGQSLFGQSPFIELVDDYLLVDWRWGRICYPNDDAIVNELWTNLTSLDTKWTSENVLVDRPIAEAYYIHIEDLARYDANLKHKLIPATNYSDEIKKEWKLYTERITQDLEYTHAAYDEYKTVLSRMISEGKLRDYANDIKIHKK